MIKKPKIDPMMGLIMVCLFCANMNIFNGFYYFIFTAFFAQMLYSRNIVFNRSVIWLAVYGLALAIFGNTFRGTLVSIIKPFTFVLAYILGYMVIYKNRRKEKEAATTFVTLMLILAGGALGHYILNWVANMDTATRREVIDFWTKEVLAATNQAAMATLALAIAIGVMFSTNVNLRNKVLAFAVLAMVLAYNLTLSGRTLILMALIVMAVAVIYNAVCNKKSRRKLLWGVGLLVAVVILAYLRDWFGLRGMIDESLLVDRFTGNYGISLWDDTRIARKIEYLKHLPYYPFGGGKLYGLYGFAHDLFLDSYDEAGWFAIFSVAAYWVLTVGRLARLLRSRQTPFAVRQIVFCIYIAVFIEFWVEPVLHASPWLLASFCAIDGGVSAILCSNAENSQSSIERHSLSCKTSNVRRS